MSVGVAVISGQGAAIATDSLHVQLTPTPVMSTGFTKHVQVGRRLAAVVGVADFDTQQVTTWVAQALANARSIRDVPDELLRQSGAQMVAAYQRWRSIVGAEPAAEEFLTLLLVEAEPRGTQALTVRAATADNTLTLQYDAHAPEGTSNVLVIGAADLELVAHTDDGRTLRLAQRLQGVPITVPAVEELPTGLSSVACEQLARHLVAGAVSRESSLPRPGWWPDEIPVLAGPVHSARV